MEILTSFQMRQSDDYTINSLGISALQLMENAGSALYDVCRSYLKPHAKVLIICGTGNNGGDGLVAARIFHNAGFDVNIYILNTTKCTYSEEWQEQFKIITSLKIPATSTFPHDKSFDLIIDALFGTGLNRPLSGAAADAVKSANNARGLKVSADIPSGLDASTPAVVGEVFKADITVAFCRGKIAHYLYPAKAFCGEVVVSDIGIPDEAVESMLYDLTEDLLPPLPVRHPGGHKGTYGHAVIIGGSMGRSGAAVMASLSALRAGAGLVTCVVPKGCAPAVMCHPELMYFCPPSENCFSLNDVAAVLDVCQDKSVIAIGPGLGRRPETAAFINEIINNTDQPLVIDADALYAVNENVEGRAILTPHIGEFASMNGVDKETVLQTRLEASREYAQTHNVHLVLKSAETIISQPDGTQYISSFGHPALSKGGSGDILTGITSALVAQRYTLADACKLACYMQGAAAAAAVSKHAAYAVTPVDIIQNIGVNYE